jgi:hypothetical protein
LRKSINCCLNAASFAAASFCYDDNRNKRQRVCFASEIRRHRSRISLVGFLKGDVPDEEGMILPDFDAARREASRSLAQLARAEIHSQDLLKLTISVRTSEGPVFEAALQQGFGTTH